MPSGNKTYFQMYTRIYKDRERAEMTLSSSCAVYNETCSLLPFVSYKIIKINGNDYNLTFYFMNTLGSLEMPRNILPIETCLKYIVQLCLL
jgi:hypothetical protein